MNKMRNRVLTVTFLMLLAVAASAIIFFAVIRPADRGFTEFYLLDAGGGVTGYPEEVHAGDTASITAVVVSHERETTSYQLVIRLGDEKTTVVDTRFVEPDEKWQETINFVPEKVTPEEKVEFLLYKNGQAEPYRKLHLWLNVQSRTP